MSCQLIALWTGVPVARSHSTVVSRWLVIPSADEVADAELGGRERVARRRAGRCARSPRVVLDVPGAGEDLAVLDLADGDDARRSRRR